MQRVISTTEVAGKMSELQISPQEGVGDWSSRQGRVLIEKDGKFDLVSLREIESRGLLPPLPCSYSDAPHHPSPTPPSPRSGGGIPPATNPPFAPKPPPSDARNRPNSAGQAQRAARRASKRRVQSASNAASHVTFALSPEQKLRQLKQQQRKERMRREVTNLLKNKKL